jgi:hypothetical protein
VFARLVASALVALSFGCAAESPEDLAAHEEGEARPLHARVLVERSADSGTVRTNVSAKFFQVVGKELELADRFIGFGPALPAEGECMAMTALDGTLTRPSTDFAVDLLDVGDVVLSLPRVDSQTLLAARAFPDVGEIVSGVFYTSPNAELGLPAPGRYKLEAGCFDVQSPHARSQCLGTTLGDGLTIEAVAPSPPTNAGLSAGASVRRGSDLKVRWDVDATPSVQSTIYLDFIAERSYRCSFADEGAAVLPSEITSDAVVGEQVTIVVHRLSRQQLKEEGEQPFEATVLFDLSESFEPFVQ